MLDCAGIIPRTFLDLDGASHKGNKMYSVVAERLGVTAELPDQFKECVPGRILIVDGDALAYAISYSTNSVHTAVVKYINDILCKMFLAKAERAVVHLTSRFSKKNYRYLVKAHLPYQQNRKKKSMPIVLEPLREALAKHDSMCNIDFILHRELEADDGVMIDSYAFKEHGVVYSEDKDLRTTPYKYFCTKTAEVLPEEPVGYVGVEHSKAGAFKLTGRGPMFFWGQMLAGDTADNVRGIQHIDGKLVGCAGAYYALGGMKSVDEAANYVINKYKEIRQNVVAEGWLLWLLRHPSDSVIEYMLSLDLTPENREYVEECADEVTRELERRKEEESEASPEYGEEGLHDPSP